MNGRILWRVPRFSRSLCGFPVALSFSWLVGLPQVFVRAPVNGSNPLSSPTKTRTGSCGRSRLMSRRISAVSCSSLEVHRSPLRRFTSCVHSWQIRRPCHRLEVATPRACSALVVLPDFGGLLRWMLAGLLRPAFGHGVHLVSRSGPRQVSLVRSIAFPEGALPFKAFPSLAAHLVVSRSRLPFRVSPSSDPLPPLGLVPRCVSGVATIFAPDCHSVDLRVFLRQRIRCYLLDVSIAEMLDALVGLFSKSIAPSANLGCFFLDFSRQRSLPMEPTSR